MYVSQLQMVSKRPCKLAQYVPGIFVQERKESNLDAREGWPHHIPDPRRSTGPKRTGSMRIPASVGNRDWRMADGPLTFIHVLRKLATHAVLLNIEFVSRHHNKPSVYEFSFSVRSLAIPKERSRLRSKILKWWCSVTVKRCFWILISVVSSQWEMKDRFEGFDMNFQLPL